ncbi:MAG: hypothetical protein II603_01040, partial [Muribaculaceae bacterium]|nr:hypothetical protein [Muribaculaceae bacterium]
MKIGRGRAEGGTPVTNAKYKNLAPLGATEKISSKKGAQSSAFLFFFIGNVGNFALKQFRN